MRRAEATRGQNEARSSHVVRWHGHFWLSRLRCRPVARPLPCRVSRAPARQFPVDARRSEVVLLGPLPCGPGAECRALPAAQALTGFKGDAHPGHDVSPRFLPPNEARVWPLPAIMP